MSDIKILDKSVWGQIAAGEVVEKPASIVKELVENSIDAGAKNITIEIKDGGTKLISIADDGCGIKSEQIELAFVPHATSKLRTIDDLYALNSMGFRGEALASIAAVSEVELATKTASDDIGYKIVLKGGEKQNFTEIATVTGTHIKVQNLFFNTPARAKFLRKNKTEENDITSYVEKLMLSHCNINFKYIIDDKLIYNTTNCTMLDIIYTIYGKEVAENMIEVNYKKGDYIVNGYVSKPTVCKSNRTYQSLFVNKRFCINQMISASISNAYETFLMKGKFPVYVLFLTLPKDSVDVNVHPNKLEVKFENSQHIYGLFNNAVYDVLTNQTHIKEGMANQEDIVHNNFVFNKVESFEGVSFDNQKAENTSTLTQKPETAVITTNDNSEEYVSEIYNTDNAFKNDTILVFNQEPEYLKKPLESYFTELKENMVDINSNTQQEQVIYDNLFDTTKKVIGVAFNTYIIVESENILYFIDQHAAHERQLFDKFIKQVENNDIPVQELLVPYIMNVNNYEAEFIDKNINILLEYGFSIDEFGKNCYRVTSIPLLLNGINLKEYFDEIFTNLNGLIKKPYEVIRDYFATKACKAAVKAGNVLSDKEIAILIHELKENKNTLLCPHGRPIVITFDKKQIEKMFKRIV